MLVLLYVRKNSMKRAITLSFVLFSFILLLSSCGEVKEITEVNVASSIQVNPFLEKLFAHDLWHFNRKTVSYAFLNGIFWACMPIPFQMVGAAITALVLRCNVPVSVGLCWLTNPITMPPYFVIAYTVGAWILNSKSLSLPENITQAWIQEQLALIWFPLLTGSILIGVSMGLLGLISLRLWWRWRVNHEWKRRRRFSRFIRRSGADHDAIQTVGRSEQRLDDHESR